MSTTVQDVLDEARQLTPIEQLDLIRAPSESLQTHYQQAARHPKPQVKPPY